MDANQVYITARAAGFSVYAAVTATAIALAESSGNPAAIGDTNLTTATWGPSVGLMQIRSLKADSGTGKSRDATKLTDPLFNMKAAYAISAGGTSWGAWSTFTNGTYKKYLASAQGARLSQDPILTKKLATKESWVNILIDAGINSLPGGQLINQGSDALAGAIAGGAGNPLATAQSALALLAKAGAWTADSHNWARVALVVAGSAGVLIGLAMLAKAGAGPVSTIAGAPASALKAANNATAKVATAVIPAGKAAKVAGAVASAKK